MNMYLLDTLSNVGCIMLETFYIMLVRTKASGFSCQQHVPFETSALWNKWSDSQSLVLFLARYFTMTMAHHYSHL